MKTYKQCLVCFKRQAADVCTMAKLGRKQTETVLKTVRSRITRFERKYPPVRMAIEIHDLVREESGISDPYAELKQSANIICRQCVPVLNKKIAESPNPFKTAVQLAIAGNIIDCGAYGLRKFTTEILTDIIDEVLADPLRGSRIDDFSALIKNARNILYVADNAGECFFDLPLLDFLPAHKLTYAVRGGPVLNDATTEDAQAAGIHNVCRVINTGDNAPGILLDRCSEEFRHIFESSDLVISKGQGNYESLSGVPGKTIAFLTRVKCEVIAKDINQRLNSNVLKIRRSTANKPRGKSEKTTIKNRQEVYYA